MRDGGAGSVPRAIKMKTWVMEIAVFLFVFFFNSRMELRPEFDPCSFSFF